ncbi:MAG: hypothetical protein MSS66_00800 [Selenomonadaceae bacterium]|nr:hypothetical protein [Selenomonadaceae bacterium]
MKMKDIRLDSPLQGELIALQEISGNFILINACKFCKFQFFVVLDCCFWHV